MLSLSKIKSELLENNCNLGSLCKSDNINKWSLHKPVTINKIGELTTADYLSVDFGFTNLSSLKGSLLGIYNIAESGFEFEYAKSKPPYRLSDFRRYYHYTGRWFDLEADLNGLTPKDTYELSIKFSNGGNYIDLIKGCTSCKEFDSYGFLLYYHDSALNTRYFNVGDTYLPKLPYRNLDSGITWNILPCLANTKGKGVSNTFYNTDTDFSYLLLDSNGLQFRYEYEKFPNLWYLINWDLGGYTNGVGKFAGAITFHNDNNTDITFDLLIMNNSKDSVIYTEMFSDTITVTAGGWYEILSGDLANTVFNCDDSASIRVIVTLEGESADGVATILRNSEIPKQFTFKYNNGAYVEQ